MRQVLNQSVIRLFSLADAIKRLDFLKKYAIITLRTTAYLPFSAPCFWHFSISAFRPVQKYFMLILMFDTIHI
ncbi:MAG: hypothetical protein UHO61_07765 [Acutalibacteraceae bacterium]|nr:hypothetical protein [Acutalibacteraceae bacterium]